MSRPARTISATVLAAALALSSVVGVSTAAHAEARISVTNDRGTALADDGRATSFTLRGSGFQSIEGGFGGVYVAFGWVRDPAGGGWRPSEGGMTGRDYRYVPDSESGSNAGYLRFVSFPGSSTEGEAQAVMSSNGSFSVDLAVPGPTFDAVDRDGNAVAVDCREVTCGVITFGAHGVKNARNETFTPVRFGEVYADASDAPQAEEPTAAPESETGEQPGESASTPGAGTTRPATTARRVRPKVTTERRTAQEGRGLAFTGRGFAPGEQVLALLDDGVVSLGPLVAGSSGEVAGVMALPVGLGVGTHQLKLIGAASGARPNERFPVRAADPSVAAEPAATTVDDEDVLPAGAAPMLFVLVAATALASSLVLLVVRLRRRRTHAPPVARGVAA